MRYKKGEEVVLRDGRLVEVSKPVEWGKNETVYEGVESIPVSFSHDYINHEKTAELQKKDKALNHYQGELEKIVEQRNNDDYTKALMKYGRREGDNLDAIKPKHYRQGMIDRIEVWYQTMPFEGFRWAMKSHIDKYNHRYEEKNGVEDLDKMMYFAKRLKEYELKEKEIERCET